MAMTIKNIGGKIIGIGEVTVLPGKTEKIPEAFETSPILEVYKRMGMAEITGEPTRLMKNDEEIAKEKAEAEKKSEEDAEKLRQARIASLEGITEENLGRLAIELGINLAECRTQKDVLKKVEETLKK